MEETFPEEDETNDRYICSIIVRYERMQIKVKIAFYPWFVFKIIYLSFCFLKDCWQKVIWRLSYDLMGYY